MPAPTTLVELFDRLAPARDTAVVDGDLRLSRAGLHDLAGCLAAGLHHRGVGHGDVVAWQLPNWYESMLCYQACWLLGAVAGPLHHRAGPSEVGRWLETLSPALVIAAPGVPAHQCATSVIEVRGDGSFESLLASDEASLMPASVDPDDRALVMFTSGSSSEPKGVVHTHRSLSHKASEMVGVHALTPADVVLMPAPLAHVSGLLNGILVPAAAGMATVLMDQWDPATALDLIEREHVSFMVGPPTFFHGLLDEPAFSSEKVESLRLISCGGSGVSPAFVREASARLDAVVKRSYGSTEAPTVTTSHAGDPVELGATTDGRASGAAELRLTDPRSGDVLPADCTGELWVRGPEVFAGYLDEAQTAEVLVDGWFRTGDLAHLDADGWLTIVGRVKDVIIRGGENIAPGEIEAALEEHPAISRAVAVGLPDARLGEVVGVAIVADRPIDADACRAWFAEQGLARFKAPAAVMVVDEVPLLASGKPDRRSVLDILVAGRSA